MGFGAGADLEFSYSRQDVLHGPGDYASHHTSARTHHGVSFPRACLAVAEQANLGKQTKLRREIRGPADRQIKVRPHVGIFAARVGLEAFHGR